MDEKRSWKIEAGVVLICAVPIYLSAYFSANLTVGFWVHLGVVALYALFLLLFGRGAAIEFAIPPVIIAILFAVIFPVFKAAKTRAERQRQRQAIIAPAPQPPRR